MIYNIIFYGFPFILVMFEWGLKTMIKVDASSFVGPALAAAALSVLIGVTKSNLQTTQINNKAMLLVDPKIKRLEDLAWLMILIFLFLWVYTCYISIAEPLAEYDIYLLTIRKHITNGFAMYGVSAILSIVKERAQQ